MPDCLCRATGSTSFRAQVRDLICPKSGTGGGKIVLPLFLKGGGTHIPPCPLASTLYTPVLIKDLQATLYNPAGSGIYFQHDQYSCLL